MGMKSGDRIKMSIQHYGYCNQTVFNVTETAIYWKRLPELMFEHDPEYHDSLSLILGANAAGDCKLNPVVIHRSEKPDALKNKSKASLPVIWNTSSGCNVTASIFNHWFKLHFIPEVERFCHSQNIPVKVLLVLQRNVCHNPSAIVNFDSRIRVDFLDTAQLPLQPMKQKVISTFKSIYIKQLFHTIDPNCDSYTSWKALNILDAVRTVSESWFEVSKTTLKKAWTALGILNTGLAIRIPDQIDETVEEIVYLANKIKLDLNGTKVMKFLKECCEELSLDHENDEQIDESDEEADELMAMDNEEGTSN